MIRHFDGVAEIVDDIKPALAFYRDTLGLEVTQQLGDDYAVIAMPGILHFAVWSRSHAALSTYGTREAADRIPLGFSVELEVDDLDAAAAAVAASGAKLVQSPKLEPWGQKTSRMIAVGGSLLGLAETPWGRVLK